jgi:hypothetical protein
MVAPIDFERQSRSGSRPAPAPGAKQAQRKESQEGRTPAEILPVLSVESPRVHGGVFGRLVELLSAGVTAASAVPAHRVALAFEAIPMAEHPTTQHHGRG